jgi:hypothetical protein
MEVISYDNTTGLPKTFRVFLGETTNNMFTTFNNYISIKYSPGTYYLHIYYPSPYYYSFVSISDFGNMPSCPSDITNISSSNLNGGWCSDSGGFGAGYSATGYPYYINPHYSYPYALTLEYSGCNVIGNVNLTRYLNVRFNPAYPVLVSFFSNPNEYLYVTLRNPLTNQNRTIFVSLSSGNPIYDLRQIMLHNGLDPYLWNEIVNVKLFLYKDVTPYCSQLTAVGFFLQYMPVE